MKKIYSTPFFLIMVSFVLYLFLSFSSWREPIMGDEVNLAIAIKAVREKETAEFFIRYMDRVFGIWHPPAYVHIVAILSNLSGFNELTARSIGIASFLLSLILIYFIAKELFRNDQKSKFIALLSCFLYSLNPLTIRGSLLVDIDGTILNVVLLIFIFSLVLNKHGSMGLARTFICGILFAITLWTKFTTPTILIVSMLIYQSLKKDFGKLLQILKIFLLGVFLFFVTWFFYCYLNKRDFFAIFDVPLSVVKLFLAKNSKIANLGLIARNIWAIFIWCSPSFFILGFISLINIFRQRTEESSLMSLKQLAFYGAIVSIVYVFVGGVTHSFPKYHYAMLPIFVILISHLLIKDEILNQKLLKVIAILVAVSVIYNVYLVKDPLYTINYALKEEIILRNGQFAYRILSRELIQIFLILLSVVFSYVIFVKKTKQAFLLSLFTSLIAFNLSLSLVQMKADYNTIYCYGAKGVREVADFVRLRTGIFEPIFAPPEIIWLANKNLSSYSISGNLQNPDKFLQTIKENNLRLIVYGITGNTVDQYKRIFNDSGVQQFLKAQYAEQDIGSYKIWFKK